MKNITIKTGSTFVRPEPLFPFPLFKVHYKVMDTQKEMTRPFKNKSISEVKRQAWNSTGKSV